ncbi:hypothetical protein VTO42DRAFT_7057 [Malbranchea cinnamomea]
MTYHYLRASSSEMLRCSTLRIPKVRLAWYFSWDDLVFPQISSLSKDRLACTEKHQMTATTPVHSFQPSNACSEASTRRAYCSLQFVYH